MAVDSAVSATFSVAMNEGTLAGVFTLTSADGVVAGVQTYNAAQRRLTFTPNEDLDYSTEYNSSVARTVRSTAGGRLAGATTGLYSWTFTTEDEPEPGEPTEVTSVTVTPSTPGILVGGTVRLSAQVVATGGASEALIWSSSNTGVATVSDTGLVTGVATGTATITATSVATPGVSGSATVTVANAPAVNGITVDPTTLTLEIGDEVLVSVEVNAIGGADESVAWATDDDTVATVDATGVVTAVADGTATITVTSVFDTSVEAEVEVTVLAMAPRKLCKLGGSATFS